MGLHLITGDNDALSSSATADVVHRLVGGGDRSLMVDDYDSDEYELAAVVDAAQTPPFLTESRVVVARRLGRFTADEVAPLVELLTDLLPTTELVLVGGGGRLVKALVDGAKRAGATVVDSAPPSRARDRSDWFAAQVKAVGLRIEPRAMTQLVSWLGEDSERLPGVLHVLASAYGADRVLGAADLAPFLGDAGDIPPWDLTDAIDRGETAVAMDALQRMVNGGRHPLQIMAILHNQYARLLALDGADARDEASAAAAMGIKPGFPARKALDLYRRLGSAKVVRAISLLAQADLDLRGAKEWPDDLVMEVLVARLSRL